MASSQLATIKHLKDIPALRQLFGLAAIAVAVAGGLWLWSWSKDAAYTPLFNNLSDKDAGEAADNLRAAGIPYRIDNGALVVPQSRVYDARLKLASQGLPHDASQGFELIQEQQSFGTSQFIENARYQHALETELARTIGNLQPVRGARVHLAIPKPSAFARKEDAPSASVFVELYSGRSLDRDQVASIVHLVASSVPGLQPASVTVIDQLGHLLSDTDPDSPVARSAEQFEHTRRIEADYVRRIEQLLAPMMGSGRVNAQVTADMDFSEVEEAREQYGAEPQKVRSEQISEDVTRSASGKSQGGVPGATSNQPPANQPAQALTNAKNAQNPQAAQQAQASTDDIQSQSKQESRTFEMDRTLSHTRQPVGRLRRLSVAVLLDNLPRPKAAAPADAKDKDKGKAEAAAPEMVPTPLTAEELAKVEALVKEAVGFSGDRGDTVSVQNASFITTEIAAPEELPIWKQPQTREIAQQVGGVLLVLVLLLVIVRPTLRQLLNAPLQRVRFVSEGGEGGEAMALPGATAGGGQMPAAIGAGGMPEALPAGGYEQKLQLARKAVGEDPKRVAQVVKTWVNQEGS
ncbi:flagellar M-ring protein FliF [Solimonas aquatica]|uniref:Flagellar M-ring protein n=1 Tax=Solimonas aquatica TaxID=489703 RepID=A0A1H9HJF6_9GAMM|nr:flagellar basal-body MS-ring/collar protein FliF [Solimonas aquatica]SEQ62454.1 flagellar M-ring protein FliF [Solimonas aquatica]